MPNAILIDDDKNQLFLNKILLEEENVFQHIFSFCNPLQALNHIKEKIDISEDVIIVDINMPQMTAWEFLKNISTNLKKEKIDALKLFVTSFSSNPKDIDRANNHMLVTKFIPKENIVPEMKTFTNAHKES